MQWNPDEYEETSFEPIPDGEYNFTVIGANEKTSKSGNAMIELELQFDIGGGNVIKVYDRLVSTPKALWRIRSFCAGAGRDFTAGALDDQECIGMPGRAKLVLGEKNEKGKRYMQVENYVPRAGFSEAPAKVKEKPEEGQNPKKSGLPF